MPWLALLACLGKTLPAKRIYGGLGVRPLEDQNHSLLLKFVQKLHEPGHLPWKTWFTSQHPDGLGNLNPDSYIARLVLEELPRFRALTLVKVGDGEHTSFWHDRWLLNSTFAQTFPVLYSHCINPDATVATELTSPISAQLRPRLTHAAVDELRIVESCISIDILSNDPDVRILYSQPGKLFDTRAVPNALQAEHLPNPDALRVWQTKLPTKVKFFGWLLTLGRINCRAYLYHRHICSREEASCESCPDSLETADHIFFNCPVALRAWRLIGVQAEGESSTNSWLLGRELRLPSAVQYDAVLLILWHLWKARNARIFDNQHSTERDVLRRVVCDMDHWRRRFKHVEDHWDAWRNHISSRL